MTTKPPPHPAKFHDRAIEEARTLLSSCSLVLDPFAGVGRCFEIETETLEVVAVEIEKEWASQNPYTILGDSTKLTHLFSPDWFDGVFTSPTYGNRMADHHNAKDGSPRITYKHKLGRDLTPTNTGQFHWNKPTYRDLHSTVWAQMTMVCKDKAVGVFNIKNSLQTKTIAKVKKKVELPVVEWHIFTLAQLGWRLRNVVVLDTPGMRRGQNHESRVDADLLIVMELAKDSRGEWRQ